MAVTPDRHPGPIDEDEGIYLEAQAVVPSVNGEMRYVTGSGFRFLEEGALRSLDGFTLDNYILDTAGGFVYTGDGVLMTRV